MKKLFYFLIFVIGSGFFVSTNLVAVAKPAASVSSKAGASKVGLSSSAGSSSTSALSISSGSLSGSTMLDSSKESAPEVANAYTVEPVDNNPPFEYISHDSKRMSIVKFMQGLASSGYTSLEGPCSISYLDSHLRKDKADHLGSYTSQGDFKPATSGSILNKYENCIIKNLTQGVYKVNQDTLKTAIKGGKFFGRLLQSRLWVQEFYLGQLAVTVPALASGTALTAVDKKIIIGPGSVGESLSASLKQTRYMRNALEVQSQGDRYVFTMGKGKSFTPVDFFVGAIVVNKSEVAIDNKVMGIAPGGVGFLPVPATSFMNNWSNAAQGSSRGLPTREPMTLGELGTGTGGAIGLTPSSDKKTITIQFAGKSYTPKDFGKNIMSKFFDNLSPWAVIVNIPSAGAPVIIGLAQMSPADYGKYLNLDGSVMTSSTKSFTLGDVIDAPYTIYKQSYVESKERDGSRFVAGNTYSMGHYFTQGMLNGLLESSIYQPLAFDGINIPFKPNNVMLTQVHPCPGVVQMLGVGSGIDWLFLRALRITKAVLSLSGISKALLSRVEANGQPTFLKVLQDPERDYFAHAGQSVDASGGHSSYSSSSIAQNNDSSFSRGWGSVPSVKPKKKEPKKKSVKSKNLGKYKKIIASKKKVNPKKAIVKNGDILYIGSSIHQKYPYIPIILIQKSAAPQVRKRTGVQRGASSSINHRNTHSIGIKKVGNSLSNLQHASSAKRGTNTLQDSTFDSKNHSSLTPKSPSLVVSKGLGKMSSQSKGLSGLGSIGGLGKTSSPSKGLSGFGSTSTKKTINSLGSIGGLGKTSSPSKGLSGFGSTSTKKTSNSLGSIGGLGKTSSPSKGLSGFGSASTKKTSNSLGSIGGLGKTSAPSKGLSGLGSASTKSTGNSL